jgi:hypothetical protein
MMERIVTCDGRDESTGHGYDRLAYSNMLDIYKKGTNSRYGSLDSSESLADLAFLSLCVYLPLSGVSQILLRLDCCSLSTLLSRKAPVVTMPCTKMTTRYPPSPSSTTHTTCTPTLPSATSYTTSEARRLTGTIEVPLDSQLQLPSIGSHLQGQLSRRSC